MTLKQGTTLQGGKYIIKKVLGQGGFGITYLAEHTLLGANVAIKEFFMRDLNNREEPTSQVSVGSEGSRELVAKFKAKFLKEARNIFKLSHPNIIRIFDIFEENGTAYYVMEYCEGGSLGEILKQYPNGLPEEQALTYIRQVASAVGCIHEQKMIHLDIKPGNIMLNAKGEAVLIDFGLSKQYDANTGDPTSTSPIGISEGYAPLEQYVRGGLGEFSPATDIYALGATLYKLITGNTPPHASIVNEDGVPPFSATASVHKTIEAAMRPLRGDRPQSVKYFLDNLAVRSDEDTIGLVDPYKAERERLMREAAAKAAKEKAEEEARAREERENRKREEAARKRKEQEEKTRKKTNIIKYSFGAVTIAAIVIGFFIFNSPSKSQLNTINGHEWVDLGLSVKWATCNVGANRPSDYGGYYAWGEISTKSEYNYDNYFDYVGIWEWPDDTSFKKYKGENKKIEPQSGHDTARENWGGTWRMPTDEEFNELIEKCIWIWTNQNGHNGYKITGPSGQSIFLPASGWKEDTEVKYAGEHGDYWTNVRNWEGYNGISLGMDIQYYSVSPLWGRANGMNIRPVTE